jgi:RHS repeat-associated protein
VSAPQQKKRKGGPPASAGTVDYLYDVSGRQQVVLNSSGSPIRAEIYAGKRHLGTYTNSTTYFSHADWLGTERVRTDVSKNTIESCQNSPYGDMQSCTGTDRSPLHFTGYERDPESGNDNAMARYFSSQYGRFMSPDPTGISLGNKSDPQQLNLYGYVRNNPLTGVDPSGTECVWDNGSFDSNGDPNTGSPDQCSGSGGTWIDHSYFQNNNLPDWSPDSNAVFGGMDFGNGPDIIKNFQQIMACSSTASQVMSVVQNHFDTFANFSTKSGPGGLPASSFFYPPPGQLTARASMPITAFFGSSVVNKNISVNVGSTTPNTMTFQTVPGHLLYPAQITFSSSDAGNGNIDFSIEVGGNYANLGANILFNIFGGSGFEDNQWNHVLLQVASMCSAVQ